MYKSVDTVQLRLTTWNPQPDEATRINIDGELYRPHPHGGGLVAVTAHVGSNVLVDKGAMIKGRAVVVGLVRLFGQAFIEEDAVVTDYCTLHEQSSIGGRAIVRGGVHLSHNARIEGTAHVTGAVRLQHFARINQGSFSGSMTVN